VVQAQKYGHLTHRARGLYEYFQVRTEAVPSVSGIITFPNPHLSLLAIDERESHG